MKVRKKPIIVEAHQWFKNGDHPKDCSHTAYGSLSEGEVVRYFRHPKISGAEACSKCLDVMMNHGWIDTLEGGHIVCPSDWIITGVEGEHYPCKDSIFKKTYEEVTE